MGKISVRFYLCRTSEPTFVFLSMGKIFVRFSLRSTSEQSFLMQKDLLVWLTMALSSWLRVVHFVDDMTVLAMCQGVRGQWLPIW